MIPFFISHTLQMKQFQRQRVVQVQRQRVVRMRSLLVVLPKGRVQTGRRRVQTRRRRRTSLLPPPRSLLLCKVKLHHLKRLWTRWQQQLQRQRIMVKHLVSLLPMLTKPRRASSARQDHGMNSSRRIRIRLESLDFWKVLVGRFLSRLI